MNGRLYDNYGRFSFVIAVEVKMRYVHIAAAELVALGVVVVLSVLILPLQIFEDLQFGAVVQFRLVSVLIGLG
jgi:hypothetical protein